MNIQSERDLIKRGAQPAQNGVAETSFAPFSDEWIQQPIIDRFQQVVNRFGDKSAVKGGDLRLTYRELLRAAAHLAQRIEAKVSAGSPVGVMLGISPLTPVAMLACLMARCPYIPFNPNFPAARNEQIIRDAGLAAMIIDSSVETSPTSLPSLPLLDIQSSLMSRDEPIVGPATAEGPAFVLYTSGSTGVPKGICYDQRSILERVANATNMKGFSADDRFFLVSAPGTIGGLRVTLAALLNGATLNYADPHLLGINGVLKVFEDAKITAGFAVPSLLRSLLGASTAMQAFAHARVLRTGGDVLLKSDLALWRSVLPSSCRVFITLTSTEMPSIFEWLVPQNWNTDSERLPVGYARPGMNFSVIDDNSKPVAPGETGELVVTSRYLAIGHWQGGKLVPGPFGTDPSDPTTRVLHTGDLVRLREDGLAEMIGRKDRQIKIRGLRVDLGEMEAVLRNHPGVANAAGIARRKDEVVSELVAYVAPRNPTNHGLIAELKSVLAKHLPVHMQPSQIRLLDAIPQLPGFKTDVKALERLDQEECSRLEATAQKEETVGVVSAKSSVATAVMDAWTRELGQQSFAADKSWGDAGGDLLKAMRLWLNIEEKLNVRLPLELMDTDARPSMLIARIEKIMISGPDQSGLENAPQKTPTVFFLPPANGDLTILANFRSGFEGRVRFVVIRYPEWRETIEAGAGFDVLVNAAVAQIRAHGFDGGCLITGYSFGGFVALETARALEEAGQSIGFIGLLDTSSSLNLPLPRRGLLASIRSACKTIYTRPRFALIDTRRRILAFTSKISTLRQLSIQNRFGKLWPSKIDFTWHLFLMQELRENALRKWTFRMPKTPFTLFRSDEFYTEIPDKGWNAVTHQMKMVRVGGDHFTMFDPPNLEVLRTRFLESVLQESSPQSKDSMRA